MVNDDPIIDNPGINESIETGDTVADNFMVPRTEAETDLLSDEIRPTEPIEEHLENELLTEDDVAGENYCSGFKIFSQNYFMHAIHSSAIHL